MKTTVKTDTGRVTVQPLGTEGRVLLSLGMPGHFPGLALTADQCGALIFGMEQALEVIDQRHRAAIESMRAAA